MLWFFVMVVCCPSGWLILWLQIDWQPDRPLPASCLAWASYITILRHGPLPSHSTQAINMTKTPPSIPPLFAPCVSSYPQSCANILKEAPAQSPLVICVTDYTNTHQCEWISLWCPVFTEADPLQGYSCCRIRTFTWQIVQVIVWVKSVWSFYIEKYKFCLIVESENYKITEG